MNSPHIPPLLLLFRVPLVDCLGVEVMSLGLLMSFRGITCRLLKSPTSQINALDVGLWHILGSFFYTRPVEGLLQRSEVWTEQKF